MKRSPLLAWLSRETEKMHRQLESTPLLSKLLDTSLSLEELCEVLQRFLWIYRPIDKALSDSLPRFLPTWRTPLWTPCLIADLAALGQPIQKADRVIFLSPETLPETLGLLYVIEGSTLGGAVIAGKLEHSPARIPRHALSFFSLGGSESPSLWERFLMIFPADSVSPEFSCDLLMGATRTFQLFLDILSSQNSTIRLSGQHLTEPLSP
ncbi:MAG: biliverdin-producing heme oxygenase [Leptospirillia bacterium]